MNRVLLTALAQELGIDNPGRYLLLELREAVYARLIADRRRYREALGRIIEQQNEPGDPRYLNRAEKMEWIARTALNGEVE